MRIELEHMTSHMLLTHITSERNHQSSSRPCATLTLMSTHINEHASHMQLQWPHIRTQPSEFCMLATCNFNGLISELNHIYQP
jgi:hypothetical protein